MYTIYTFKVNHRVYRSTDRHELKAFAWNFLFVGELEEAGTSPERIGLELTNTWI